MKEGYLVRQVAQWLNDELREPGKAQGDSWGHDNTWCRYCSTMPVRCHALSGSATHPAQRRATGAVERYQRGGSERGIQRHRAGGSLAPAHLSGVRAR